MATRFAAGFLLAQGLYYGLTLIGSGYFFMVGEENGWNSVIGRFMRPVLMLSSGLLGSMLAGAGNPRALAGGAALGLFHALALLGQGSTQVDRGGGLAGSTLWYRNRDNPGHGCSFARCGAGDWRALASALAEEARDL